MGTLKDRIDRHRAEQTSPKREEPKQEWRRRALEQVEKVGYVAVKDLTDR